ncbi:MAG: Stk1 family PASTA domain-containing Ser/Thr kinase, partial [Firmicutes bacterium]|nr:Stk1 family PASTA domain-containing Ser/Thr kinase [Bacillota bacterium]
IYDVGREGNINYIVMELIEGRTLNEIIAEEAPMDYRKVIEITKQVAAALRVAHKNKIIHRDVKPHNVMITPNGTAKITDFGIAKAVNAATIVDNTGSIVGSVHYFSPEQARGGYVDEKSDIYSLGIVMYEMLTGEVPFDGDNPVSIALQHINSEMVPPSQRVNGVPPALEHIIMKCCDKFPVNRYPSADDLIEALNNLEFVNSVVGDSVLMGNTGKETRTIKTPIPTGPIARTDYDNGEDPEYEEPDNRKGKAKSKKKRNRIILIAAIAAAVILGLVLVLSLTGGKEIETPDFTGMTLQQAEKLASSEQYDLKIKVGDEVISEEVDKGCIVSQDPMPGETIKTGGTVTVNISKGLGDGSVPDLTGKMKDDLSEYLEAAGFKLGAVTTKASDKPEGTVLSQNPKAGTEVEKGTAIDVVVSDGSKAKATVPYVLGMSLSSAKAELAEAGLTCGSVTYDYSDTFSENEVMWQQYEAGASVAKNTSVKLIVSKGSKPEPTTTEPTTAAPQPTPPPAQ